MFIFNCEKLGTESWVNQLLGQIRVRARVMVGFEVWDRVVGPPTAGAMLTVNRIPTVMLMLMFILTQILTVILPVSLSLTLTLTYGMV